MRPPSHSAVSRAVATIERLPPATIRTVVQQLVDGLDAAEPDPDLEPEQDCCEAEEGQELCQTLRDALPA